MATKLTKKQRGFVKDYVKTGIGSLAVKENYDVSTDETARAIAYENLTKPHIQKAIAERLPDDLLEERHLELLNKKETIRRRDSEGNETIEETNQIDVQAVTKGLDMAYKLKGSYAPEKSQALNFNIEGRILENNDLEEIRQRFINEVKLKLSEDSE